MKRLILLTAIALVIASCAEVREEGAGSSGDVTVTSAAFDEGAEIPVVHTCDGSEVSPPLSWKTPGRPEAFAVTVTDPDAGDYVHWIVLDLPRSVRGLEEGRLPPEAVEGTNSSGEIGYAGPCPPEGDEPHRYIFMVYALSAELEGLEEGASFEDLSGAVEETGFVAGQLTGTYRRR